MLHFPCGGTRAWYHTISLSPLDPFNKNVLLKWPNPLRIVECFTYHIAKFHYIKKKMVWEPIPTPEEAVTQRYAWGAVGLSVLLWSFGLICINRDHQCASSAFVVQVLPLLYIPFAWALLYLLLCIYSFCINQFIAAAKEVYSIYPSVADVCLLF